MYYLCTSWHMYYLCTRWKIHMYHYAPGQTFPRLLKILLWHIQHIQNWKNFKSHCVSRTWSWFTTSSNNSIFIGALGRWWTIWLHRLPIKSIKYFASSSSYDCLPVCLWYYRSNFTWTFVIIRRRNLTNMGSVACIIIQKLP